MIIPPAPQLPAPSTVVRPWPSIVTQFTPQALVSAPGLVRTLVGMDDHLSALAYAVTQQVGERSWIIPVPGRCLTVRASFRMDGRHLVADLRVSRLPALIASLLVSAAPAEHRASAELAFRAGVRPPAEVAAALLASGLVFQRPERELTGPALRAELTAIWVRPARRCLAGSSRATEPVRYVMNPLAWEV